MGGLASPGTVDVIDGGNKCSIQFFVHVLYKQSGRSQFRAEKRVVVAGETLSKLSIQLANFFRFTRVFKIELASDVLVLKTDMR